MKKITFHSQRADLDIVRPFPASRLIPSWYKKMKGIKQNNMTVKKCVPFLDALTSGYILSLPADMAWDKEAKNFMTQAKISMNEDHMLMQTEDVVLPPEFNPQPHKWINQWFIKTPPGYSTLFIHPLNRLDLPFYSFSAIVDTDRHPTAVNFPFVLREDFDGVIKAGTPIIQAIPFKRDDWDAKIIDTGKSYKYSRHGDFINPPFSLYKKRFWARKRYTQDNTITEVVDE